MLSLRLVNVKLVSLPCFDRLELLVKLVQLLAKEIEDCVFSGVDNPIDLLDLRLVSLIHVLLKFHHSDRNPVLLSLDEASVEVDAVESLDVSDDLGEDH